MKALRPLYCMQFASIVSGDVRDLIGSLPWTVLQYKLFWSGLVRLQEVLCDLCL